MNEKMPVDNEAEIMMPDRDLVINGETVTVKEFRFRQGMMAEQIASRIIGDIISLTQEKGADDLTLADISFIFSNNWRDFTQLLKMSTGLDADYIEGLDDNNGQALMNTFWVVNSGFFMRRLMSAVVTNRVKQKPQSDSVSSSPH